MTTPINRHSLNAIIVAIALFVIVVFTFFFAQSFVQNGASYRYGPSFRTPVESTDDNDIEVFSAVIR